jgi:hypothetical protein
MRQWIRAHLTYANVISTLCLFLLLGGGTAVALNGTNTVQSDDLGPGAQVKQADVADNAVNSADVVNNSLTGADIANRSGVDTCQTPLTVKLGPICAGSDGQDRSWTQAYDYCRGLGLRLPTVGEAGVLGTKHDVPAVASNAVFWTDDLFEGPGADGAIAVHEDGGAVFSGISGLNEAVCVTDPSA